MSFSDRCVKEIHFTYPTTKADFALMTMSHSNSPQRELVFFTAAPFHLTLSLQWQRWCPYSHMRVVALLFPQTENSMTGNIWTILYCWMKIQVSSRFLSIVWTTAWVCLACVLYLRSVKCYCTAALSGSWTLFLPGKKWVRWINLITWAVLSHSMVVCPKECLLAYKNPDWHLLIRGSWYFDVTTSYRSNGSYS